MIYCKTSNVFLAITYFISFISAEEGKNCFLYWFPFCSFSLSILNRANFPQTVNCLRAFIVVFVGEGKSFCENCLWVCRSVLGNLRWKRLCALGNSEYAAICHTLTGSVVCLQLLHSTKAKRQFHILFMEFCRNYYVLDRQLS